MHRSRMVGLVIEWNAYLDTVNPSYEVPFKEIPFKPTSLVAGPLSFELRGVYYTQRISSPTPSSSDAPNPLSHQNPLLQSHHVDHETAFFSKSFKCLTFHFLADILPFTVLWILLLSFATGPPYYHQLSKHAGRASINILTGITSSSVFVLESTPHAVRLSTQKVKIYRNTTTFLAESGAGLKYMELRLRNAYIWCSL